MTDICQITDSLNELTVDSLDEFIESFDNLTINTDSNISNQLNKLTMETEKDMSNFIKKFKNLEINNKVVEQLDDKLINNFKNMSIKPTNMNFLLCIFNIIRARQQMRCSTFAFNHCNRLVDCH